jgi:hypothetical protein
MEPPSTSRLWNLTFTKLDKATHKELKLMAYGRPHVFVEDYNGNIFVMGLLHGAEVTGGTIVTGSSDGRFEWLYPHP